MELCQLKQDITNIKGATPRLSVSFSSLLTIIGRDRAKRRDG